MEPDISTLHKPDILILRRQGDGKGLRGGARGTKMRVKAGFGWQFSRGTGGKHETRAISYWPVVATCDIRSRQHGTTWQDDSDSRRFGGRSPTYGDQRSGGPGGKTEVARGLFKSACGR